MRDRTVEAVQYLLKKFLITPGAITWLIWRGLEHVPVTVRVLSLQKELIYKLKGVAKQVLATSSHDYYRLCLPGYDLEDAV